LKLAKKYHKMILNRLSDSSGQFSFVGLTFYLKYISCHDSVFVNIME